MSKDSINIGRVNTDNKDGWGIDLRVDHFKDRKAYYLWASWARVENGFNVIQLLAGHQVAIQADVKRFNAKELARLAKHVWHVFNAKAQENPASFISASFNSDGVLDENAILLIKPLVINLIAGVLEKQNAKLLIAPALADAVQKLDEIVHAA